MRLSYTLSSANRLIAALALPRDGRLSLAALCAAGLIVALLALLGGAQPARAASFVVTKTEDTNDGACDADCSLREAIIAANAAPGHDTITLGPGVYTLSRLGRNENLADTGDLDIYADLTLIGAGANLSIIDGLGLDGVTDRVLDIYTDPWAEAKIAVHVSGITIRNGHVDEDPGACWVGGGGIRARDASLTLENTIVTNNRTDSAACTTGSGGGLYFEQTRFPVTLTITGTQILSNTARYGGGGVYVWQYWGVSAPLTMTLTNSRVMSNAVESGAGPALGGGIYFAGDSEAHPAPLTLQNSTVAGNRAYGTEGLGGSGFSEGGGIHFNSYGPLIIYDSAITDNSALGNSSSYIVSSGGGIYFDYRGGATLRIEDSAIERNVSNDGGGLYAIVEPLYTWISNSSISANRAMLNAGNYGGSGGGIFGDLRLSHVTLRGNTATQDGGGVYGGAYGGSAQITNSLIADNTAGSDGGGLAGRVQVISSTIMGNQAANGGGLAVTESEIAQSLIAGNTAVKKGGGISLLQAYRGGPTVEIRNSTISGNQAAESAGISHGGPVYKLCQGGAKDGNKFQYGYGGKMLLDNTTIAANVSPTGTGGIRVNVETRDRDAVQAAECPLGYVNWGTGSDTIVLEMVNVLLAANDGDNCTALPADASRGHNLSDDGSCVFTAPGDRVKVNAKLGPLADNGGPTLTHALLDGSPAIDAGDAASCPATDQRGVTRPQGPGCDIGAFEWQPTTPYLAVAPAALTFVAVAGAQPPPAQPFTVTNTGLGALAWTATENTPWLSVSPPSGAAPASPNVSVNQAGLPVGEYMATITVAAAGAGGSPQAVAVTLRVIRVQDVIGNWDFEQGRVAWTESSTTLGQLIRPANQFAPPFAPHAGAWAALLGVNNGEISDLSQPLTLPAGISLTLSFHYYAVSVETECAYDTVQVRLDNTVIDQIGLCQANNTNGWRQRTVDLGRFASPQFPVLRFRVVNDPSSDPSSFALDDVQLGTPPPVYDHFIYLPLTRRAP